MKIRVHASKAELGQAAAAQGVRAINSAIETSGKANVVLATGASQFEMLDALVGADIDWSRVNAFHLDEYVGIDPTHPASFRGYLKQRFLDRVGPLGKFTMIEGDAVEIDAEVQRLCSLLGGIEPDVCFAGIGENCHLAFNDPPADFETLAPYVVVQLDEDCRRQQLGEGWFNSLDEVPARAISMSISQIMKSRSLVLSVSDVRKARAVQQAVEGKIDPRFPASIIQNHANVALHLDKQAAGQLRAEAED